MTCEQLATAGFPVSEAAHRRLGSFVTALLDENSRHNLTAIRTEPEIWRLHVCDSLALSPLLLEYEAVRLLDLGSGGGVPGVPLACVHDEMSVTLLDATRKKVDAALRIADAVGLKWVAGLWARAELSAHERVHREKYDVLTARAVTNLASLVELSAAFVRVGGVLLFPKSQEGADREIPAASMIAEKCGLRLIESRPYRLPREDDDRVIAVYRKVEPTPFDFPRASELIGRPF